MALSKAVFVPLNNGVTYNYKHHNKPEYVKFMDGSLKALGRFQKEGFKIILYCTWNKNDLSMDFCTILKKKLYLDHCIIVNDIVFWKWGDISDEMIHEIAAEHNIDLSKSWVISQYSEGVSFCTADESRFFSCPKLADVPRLIARYC